jgi:hypothetical protein
MGRLDFHRVTVSNRFICELMMHIHLLRLPVSVRGRAIYYGYGISVCPVVLAVLAGIRRERVIYHAQDLLEPRRHGLHEFFEKRFARRAGDVVIHEANRTRFFKSYYGLARVPALVRAYLPASWA